MHFHVNWAGSGFNSERFDHYHEAIEAAQASLENGGRLDVISNETFSIELFDEPCPVCMRERRQ